MSEIERLRELADAGKEDRKAIDELVDENLRLRSFIEEVFEIAFGDDAINRDFSYEEVLERLREFSDKSFAQENNDE
jgi:hypothetical protein